MRQNHTPQENAACRSAADLLGCLERVVADALRGYRLLARQRDHHVLGLRRGYVRDGPQRPLAVLRVPDYEVTLGGVPAPRDRGAAQLPRVMSSVLELLGAQHADRVKDLQLLLGRRQMQREGLALRHGSMSWQCPVYMGIQGSLTSACGDPRRQAGSRTSSIQTGSAGFAPMRKPRKVGFVPPAPGRLRLSLQGPANDMPPIGPERPPARAAPRAGSAPRR